jgi:hypothetical protein
VIPDEGISGPYYTPLVVAGILYVLLNVASAAIHSRNRERAEQLADLQFGVVVLTAAYVVVMFIAALVDKSDLVKDMVEVLGIVVLFFGLLLVIMFVVFERGVGALSRARRR